MDRREQFVHQRFLSRTYWASSPQPVGFGRQRRRGPGTPRRSIVGHVGCFGQAQEAGKGEFPRAGRPCRPVFPLGLGAPHVEQIVGDLERQSETLPYVSRAANCSASAAATIAPSRSETRIMAPVLRWWMDSSGEGVECPGMRSRDDEWRSGIGNRACGLVHAVPLHIPSPLSLSASTSSTCPPTMLQAPAASAKRRNRPRPPPAVRLPWPASQRPASTARRRPKSPWPRRTPYGKWAGHAANRRRPTPAGRRGSANRREPSRPHRPQAWPLRRAPAGLRGQQHQHRPQPLARGQRLYRIASRSRAGQPSPKHRLRVQRGVNPRTERLGKIGKRGKGFSEHGLIVHAPISLRHGPNAVHSDCKAATSGRASPRH